MTQQTNGVSDCRIILSHCYFKPPGPTAHITTTPEDHPLPSAQPNSIRCRFPPQKYFLSVAPWPAPLRGQHFTPTLEKDETTLLLKQFSQHSAAGLKTSEETSQRCIFLTQNRQAITRNQITSFISFFLSKQVIMA